MDQIAKAWECFAEADAWAIRRDGCRPNSDKWYRCAALALAAERDGLDRLAKALGVV